VGPKSWGFEGVWRAWPGLAVRRGPRCGLGWGVGSRTTHDFRGNPTPRASPAPPLTTAALAARAGVERGDDGQRAAAQHPTCQRQGPERCQVPSPLKGTTRSWSCGGL